jgi:hypothetical protein
VSTKRRGSCRVTLRLEQLWKRAGFSPNDKQHEAILHTEGPLFLTAGSGSGKTRVPLWRTLDLIVFHKVPAEEIICGNLAKTVCYSKAHPYLTVIPTIYLSLGMVFAFSLVNAMIADVCDEDELASGMRREGIYFAVYNWWWKVAVSIATVLAGYLQHFTGFVEGAKMQSDATLFWLRAWEIGLPPLLCLVGAALLVKYPLTEARAYEIKALLKARKAGGATVPAASA